MSETFLHRETEIEDEEVTSLSSPMTADHPPDDGYWLVAKRLEKGTFSWPKDIEGDRRKLVLKPTALAMLTDGIDLRDGLQRPWYELR